MASLATRCYFRCRPNDKNQNNESSYGCSFPVGIIATRQSPGEAAVVCPQCFFLVAQSTNRNAAIWGSLYRRGLARPPLGERTAPSPGGARVSRAPGRGATKFRQVAMGRSRWRLSSLVLDCCVMKLFNAAAIVWYPRLPSLDDARKTGDVSWSGLTKTNMNPNKSKEK